MKGRLVLLLFLSLSLLSYCQGKKNVKVKEGYYHSVEEGSDLYLEGSYTGVAKAVIWFKGKITKSPKYENVEFEWSDNWFSFKITNITIDQGGDYTINVRNVDNVDDWGKAKIKIAVNNGVPNVPTKLHDVKRDLFSLKFDWEGCCQFINPPKRFIIEKAIGKKSTEFVFLAEVKKSGYTDWNVKEGLDYRYRIKSINDYGESEFSKPLGVYLWDTKECFVPNCRLCKFSNSTCGSCSEGFYYLKSYKACLSCPTLNCAKCEANYNGKCWECRKGYSLVNGECVANSVLDDTCEVWDSTNTYCNFCKVGYGKMWDNTCQPCADKNCKICSSAGSCLNCFDGSTLQNGICADKGQACSKTAHCSHCYPKNHCYRCYDGYYLDDDECKDCKEMVDRCIKCDHRSHKCLQCENGYHATVDGKTCIETNRTLSNVIMKKEFMNELVKGSLLQRLRNVAYYDECNDICLKNDRCLSWVWYDEKVKWRFQCLLYKSAIIKTRDHKSAIIGFKSARDF